MHVKECKEVYHSDEMDSEHKMRRISQAPAKDLHSWNLFEEVEHNIEYGPTNLQEGKRLFKQQEYGNATAYFWRAITLHSIGHNSEVYDLQDVFKMYPSLLRSILMDKTLVVT